MAPSHPNKEFQHERGDQIQAGSASNALPFAAGKLHVADEVLQEEIAVFEESETALDFVAEGETEFVLGSAVHPHELVLGYYSVHTNVAALQRGEGQIEQIRQQLKI